MAGSERGSDAVMAIGNEERALEPWGVPAEKYEAPGSSATPGETLDAKAQEGTQSSGGGNIAKIVEF